MTQPRAAGRRNAAPAILPPSMMSNTAHQTRASPRLEEEGALAVLPLIGRQNNGNGAAPSLLDLPGGDGATEAMAMLVRSKRSATTNPRGMKSQDRTKEAHKLARWNHHRELCRIVDAGTSVDIRDSNGNTLLMIAAQNGHEELCRMLVARGADVNACNARGNTPLHFAYGYGYVELGEYFRNECDGRDDKLNDDGESVYDCFTMSLVSEKLG